MLNIDDRLIKEVSPKIGANALSVLLAIAIHLNQKTNRCFPSHERLMMLTGLGRDAVYTALKKLKDNNLLSSEQTIDSKKKQFGQRVFRVSTGFIGIFVLDKECEPLTDEPYTGNPETDEPYTGNPETYHLNNKEQINHKEQIREREENKKLAPIENEFSTLNTPLKKETPQSPPLAAEPPYFSMSARTKAETPTELIDQLREFYISRMNEWNVGVMQKAKAIRYTSEQREEILLSFCCHQIKTNSGADTYGMHHAALMQWFSREKQFNQTKPATNQAAELSAIAKAQIKKRTSAPRPEWMGPEQMPGL